jgi:predicted Rossmann fold nucleotide-binding protein DprA/Smf involved in DNA uptake
MANPRPDQTKNVEQAAYVQERLYDPMLALLDERPRTTRELVTALDEPIGRVQNALRRLEDTGRVRSVMQLHPPIRIWSRQERAGADRPGQDGVEGRTP